MSDPDPELPRPLLVLRAAAAKVRSRQAPLARETSDVRRFHGVWAAGIVGAVAIAVVLAIDLGPAGLRSPAPLSRSHQNAGLECDGCHKEQNSNRGCTSCHGAHPSTRSTHRRLASAGELACTTCHVAHGGESLVFLPTGEALHHSGGRERILASAIDGFRPARVTTLPLVPSDRCAACHTLTAERDPISRCVARAAFDAGARPWVLCFDEHRSVATAGPGGAQVGERPPERDAAAEAARALLASRSAVVASASFLRPFGWIAAAMLAGLGALFVARFGRRSPSPALPVAAPRAATTVRLPQIDATTCLGCYACVDACPYDVLEVERYVAKLARPDDCCGLTLCEQRCPNGSLLVRDAGASGATAERPMVDDRLEVIESPGLYLAGDLTGLPLIKNAINQGALAVRAIGDSLSDTRAVLGRRSSDALDLIIVGAGPAGISAALEAKARGMTYSVLEQGSVAESIRSFPRGKLVFDQPLGMPVVGDLWLDECTKEELLGKWLRIVRRERLPIREGFRVTEIERLEGGPPLGLFAVHSLGAAGEQRVERCRRLLLAIGRRGSPRKLGVEIPESMADRVHYALADARSFAGQRVVVVGLGDVAMEAALALSRQPDTRVVVSYRGEGFRRGKARNIDEIRRALEAGRLQLISFSEVTKIEASRVVLKTPDGDRSVDCDALFVMIGALASASLLEAARS
jgi:thioredoxin reductase/NAD-dependent dihydropyrimidine dehydrogenase PreA subunit